MVKPLGKKIRENPMVSLLITFGMIGTAIIGINAGIDASDKWVVTHAELDEHANGIHPVTESKIDLIALKSECRWLDDKVDRLDDIIWDLKHNGADPARIHDKEQDLRRYRGQYESKGCARVKY